jgi:hypothetical protein
MMRITDESTRVLRRVPATRRALAGLLLALAGCGGEPSEVELKNRQELEMLLTAVSLKDANQLEKDARRIDARHESGLLSDARHADLQAIIRSARDGDWAAAETQAYAFREARPYFE